MKLTHHQQQKRIFHLKDSNPPLNVPSFVCNSSMSKGYVTNHILEKHKHLNEQEKPLNQSSNLPKHSNKSSTAATFFTDLVTSFVAALEQKLAVAENVQPGCDFDSGGGDLKRCNWITKNSDKLYVHFHDECWGVPVYEDKQLFELLLMCGLLIDYNWTDILKRRELLREIFAEFDPNIVAEMGEKEIMEIASDKALRLAESRVRSIINNAECILKIVRDCGSLSHYMWGYVNYKPIINKYRYSRNVPLRTPKSEAMSKDLLKRGFRLVGPVIVCSFMQASGMTIDHLVDCFRFNAGVSLAQRPWSRV